MEIKLFNDDIETLRPIAESWLEIAKGNEFNIDTNVGKHLSDLLILALGEDSNLIVLYDDEIPIGYLALEYFISHISEQKIANERYFFVIPEKRGPASMRLLKGGKYLAKQKGCSHIIFNASNLASDLHNKLCRLYKIMKMKHFDTSYISEV